MDSDWEPTGNYLSPDDGKTAIPNGEFPADKQRESFQRHAIDALHSRYEGASPHHRSGLDNLVQDGNAFAASEEPEVFFFAPLVRVVDEEAPEYGQSSANLPFLWDAQTPPHPLAYNLRADTGDGQIAFNDQLRGAIRDILGADIKITMVPYAPVPDGYEDVDIMDEQFLSPRGRGLIQYQPGDTNDCEEEAKWRVWFENDSTPRAERAWKPHDDQRCTPPEPAAERRRKRQECSLTAPFPTLTATNDIETPTGSSCASTATISRRNTGACMDVPSCVSWVATTTEEPDPPQTEEPGPGVTKMPFVENEVACNIEADFPGHADIQENGAWWGSIGFCASEKAPKRMGTYSARGPPYRMRTSDQYGVNYDWQISWIYGCTTDVNEVDILYPLGEDGPSCQSINMYNNFDGCKYKSSRCRISWTDLGLQVKKMAALEVLHKSGV